MRRTTTRIGAAIGAGLLTFSMAACAEDDDPDTIVDQDDPVAPAEPGDDTETPDDTEMPDDEMPDDTETD